MDKEDIKKKITSTFQKYTKANNTKAADVITNSLTSGKLYEAFILSRVAEQLVKKEGLKLKLVNSKYLKLKTSAGKIDRTKPRFNVYKSGNCIAEIWTDIEFTTLSYAKDSSFTSPDPGQYHELDIVVLDPNLSGRPGYDQIWLGVECKNTSYEKGLLKEILGIRRELSLLRSTPQQTKFSKWPRKNVPADPSSCLLVYSTDANVQNYSSPGDLFGIDFYFEPLNP
ncbi:hypothetical protein CK503_11205 [Aliifodinibius salipaludis]|uniref:Uncharacterized protein n=1 Tax=Fodinibius salipaludis TaxID=2032627 RepID=A0A2A2G7W6_9BACT|nr:hypothetical protein [Aliifodinibius salipaludis]PAU93711.1 hypothetical protein CK503_11205 [Aliifodinibius salipaludis]